MQHGLQDLVHRHRLLRRGERAGLEAGEVEQVAEETVEPVGLLQHRLQQVAALRVVVRGVVLEQTRDRRLDRRERRPQVVGDRGEQRGPRLVGLRVEPGHVHLRVEPGPLQRDRDLSRGRLEQPQVLAADRRLALGADHDQRPEHLAADVEGEPALLAGRRVVTGLDDLVRAAPRPRPDLAPREVQRPEQRAGEVLQDPFEALAREDLGGQVAEQPRLALATGRPGPLLERPGDERTHDRRDHEERDQRDRVLGVGDAQRVQRLGEEVVDAQQAEDRRDQPAPQTADRRGDDDAQQVDRDRPELPPRLQDEPETRRDRGREQGGPHRPHLRGSPQPSRARSRLTLRLGYGFFTPWRDAFTRRLRMRAHALGVSTHLRPETTEPARTEPAPGPPPARRPPRPPPSTPAARTGSRAQARCSSDRRSRRRSCNTSGSASRRRSRCSRATTCPRSRTRPRRS